MRVHPCLQLGEKSKRLHKRLGWQVRNQGRGGMGEKEPFVVYLFKYFLFLNHVNLLSIQQF